VIAMQLLTLILQVAVVLIAARAVGWVFRRLHQPQVVGEMAAGILLGPSLLGWLAPGVSATLFPPDSLGYLNALSQAGLIVFMFLVGLELDPKLLRGCGHTAVVTSHASIIVPFFLGSLAALYLYPRVSDASVSFTGFALFMGAAMSVTAFPVLARILTERNLLTTRIGAVSIACAAVDDVSAWSILAVVIAILRSSATSTSLWYTLGGSLIYVAVMFFGVRRALRWLESHYQARGRVTQDLLGIILLLVLASAWTTEWLGIHALFGAFTIGTIMPKDSAFVRDVMDKLEDFTVVLLLPIFFAFAGLRASIGLIDGAEMWGYFGLILLLACAGKFGGSALAARMTGLGWRESGAVGILMNTRGLMELVILNIGLDLGAISPALYTIMIMMALVTTAMTTPILELIYPARRMEADRVASEDKAGVYTVLLPVSLPSAGPGLLEAATRLVPDGRPLRVYAVHLQRVSDQSVIGAARAKHETEALQPLLAHAQQLGVDVRPLTFTTHNLARDLRDLARLKRADLVLLGWHKPVLNKVKLSDTVNAVLREVKADVAVLVDRGTRWNKVLLPYRDMAADLGALDMARRIAVQHQTEVTILHVVAEEPGELTTAWEEASFDGARLKLVHSDDPVRAAVDEAREGYDVIVVGTSKDWGTTESPFGPRHEGIASETTASLLVVRPGIATAAGVLAPRNSQTALQRAS
jgi:Kef-type K+ transport system membrane component KefB/nucleotide-binding universal stress UspA family protein